MRAFPWKQAIGFGLGVLRLAPEQFWSMTPRELSCAIEAITGTRPTLDRNTFAELMQRYPDA
ncbi:MAG TPA: rcc01693 family protein [Pseudolabrys sp.]|nr:rcc01693 family protein [Pseudolabrys sp.]